MRLIRPNEYDPQTDGGEGFQFTYDVAGRLVQRLDGVGGGVKYEYDLAWNQRRITTMGGASQELEYDARGLITGIVDRNHK